MQSIHKDSSSTSILTNLIYLIRYNSESKKTLAFTLLNPKIQRIHRDLFKFSSISLASLYTNYRGVWEFESFHGIHI